MDLDRFLNLLAALFGAMGSIYVLKGIARLSPDLAERLSQTYWGFSPAQMDSLTAQKADSIVGIILVVIALAITIFNLAVVPSHVPIFPRRAVAVAVAVALAAVSFIVLEFSGEAIHRHQRLAVGRIVMTQLLQNLFKSNRLPASEVGSLRDQARTFLGMTVKESESPRSLLNRLAAQVGLQVPKEFDFSEVEKPNRQ